MQERGEGRKVGPPKPLLASHLVPGPSLPSGHMPSDHTRNRQPGTWPHAQSGAQAVLSNTPASFISWKAAHRGGTEEAEEVKDREGAQLWSGPQNAWQGSSAARESVRALGQTAVCWALTSGALGARDRPCSLTAMRQLGPLPPGNLGVGGTLVNSSDFTAGTLGQLLGSLTVHHSRYPPLDQAGK